MTQDDKVLCLSELIELEHKFKTGRINEPYFRSRLMELVNRYNPTRDEYYDLKYACTMDATKQLLEEID